MPFEQVAADQALGMGLLSSSGPGSVTRMHRTRVVSGDGVVLQSLYNTSPDDRFVDRDTGEVWIPRADPDARRYPKKNPDRAAPSKPPRSPAGSDEVIVGVKWVTTHVNTGHELERVTLTVDHERHGAPGGEAAIAVAALKRIKGRCPGMLGASWDKALRGTHINDLYHARIQPVVKVFLEKSHPKKRRIGTYPVTDGDTRLGDIEVWGDGGKPCVYRRLQGHDEFVPLIKKQIKYRSNAGQPAALYQCAELPDDPRVPAHMRHKLVWFRHDNDGPEPDPDLNRAEVLRTVCETDRDEWCDLYYDRPGSESDNARDQNNLPNRRAPSLGARSQQVDLICLEMANHLDAEHAYQTRTTAPGAKAPPTRAIADAA